MIAFFFCLSLHTASYNNVIAVISSISTISLSLGSWSSPSLKGSRPPPYVLFSLTMIDEESAVMFGGMDPNKKLLNDVYILHMSTMVSCLLLPIVWKVCLLVPPLLLVTMI